MFELAKVDWKSDYRPVWYDYYGFYRVIPICSNCWRGGLVDCAI